MGTVQYRGYVDTKDLPIKRGDVVVVPKGTLVHHRGKLTETRRSQKVKINHVLCGMDIPVGVYYKTKDMLYFNYYDSYDIDRVRQMYGTSILEDLWPLMKTLDHGNYCTLMLPVSNPEVRWAGSGGYWSDADINQLV